MVENAGKAAAAGSLAAGPSKTKSSCSSSFLTGESMASGSGDVSGESTGSCTAKWYRSGPDCHEDDSKRGWWAVRDWDEDEDEGRE